MRNNLPGLLKVSIILCCYSVFSKERPAYAQPYILSLFSIAPQPEPPPPTLPDLLHLQIPQEVSTKYFHFGTFLLNDKMGCIVTSIEHKCLQDPVRIVNHILSEWLQGKGTEITWKSLIKALQDADLKVLAEKVAKTH